jgi:hypothetical protein
MSMKTHEFAAALTMLAAVLRRAPSQPLDEFFERPAPKRAKPDPSSIPFALSTLVSLSEVDKGQWLTFIREQGFSIDIRPRDASRDIIGKLLNFLAENPEARARVANTAQKNKSDSSSELMRALDLLLRP